MRKRMVQVHMNRDRAHMDVTRKNYEKPYRMKGYSVEANSKDARVIVGVI
jgi:hypothetical protein